MDFEIKCDPTDLSMFDDDDEREPYVLGTCEHTDKMVLAIRKRRADLPAQKMKRNIGEMLKI